MHKRNRRRLSRWSFFPILAAIAAALLVGCQAHHPEQGSTSSTDSAEMRRLAEMERMIEMQQAQLSKLFSDSRQAPSGDLFSGGSISMLPEKADTLLQKEIYYSYSEYRPDAHSRTALDEIARRMAETPSSWVEIYGYADPTGSDYRNFQLSIARAWFARGYLIQKFAIPMSRIHLQGFGIDYQKYPNDVGTGVNRNRRIEVLLKTPAKPETLVQ